MHEIKCSSPRKILLLVLLFPMCARSDSTIVRDELSSFFSTYDITRISNTKMSDGSSVLQLNVFGRILRAIVRNSTDVLHSNIRSSFSTSDGNPNHLQSIINAQYTGFLRVLGHPHLRVSMTELPTLAYFGQIETQNGTLIVEPVDMYSDHYDEKDIVVFYNRDVMIEKRMDFTRMSSPLRAPDSMSRNPMFYNPFEVYTKRRSRTKRETSKVVEDVKRNRCSLKVVADYHFFNKVARNSTARATRYILNMVANVNKIYTEQDFDAGVDDEELIMQNRKRLHGIGFSIKDIKIFDGPTEDKGHYNGPPVSGTEWRGTDLLNDFTSREGSRDFCLVVLLTAQLFVLKGELGLAWVAHDASGTAGICSGQSKDSYNTLFVTLLKSSEHGEGSILVSKEGEIVLAHGHAFGAKHDNENPDPEDQQECFPDHASGGNYIMHMYAQQGYDANNVEFSPCSIRAIRRVLVNRNDCFDEEKRSLCGNGVLEPGEQCDEGDLLPDPHRNGSSCCAHDCQLMSNAQCSPVNFPCCNEQCRFHSNAFVCSPRNELQCQDKALCTGSSGECPAPTAVPDNTECLEDGRCSAGVCLPYCERKDIGKKSCICQDLKFTCFRCCSRLNTSTCEPEPSYTVLKDGTWCSQGICKNAKCITVAADSFNSNFNVLHDKAVLWDLLSRNLVIIVLIITVAVFTCCSIIVNNKDREVREEATRAQNAPIKRRMIAFHQIPQPGVDVVNSLL